MFRSRIDSLVVTQQDHAHFAGQLASNWGNANFPRPKIYFDRFVKGVTLHDAQYGTFDSDSIEHIDESRWFQIMRTTIDVSFDDPIVEIVARMHMRRLVAKYKTPESVEIANQLSDQIEACLEQSQMSGEPFVYADQITNFCDRVAFHVPFGQHYEFDFEFSQTGNVQPAIHVCIENRSLVVVDPWPFSVDQVNGVLMTYQGLDYPSKLVSCPIRFEIRPGVDT